jgi:hypothetical protein
MRDKLAEMHKSQLKEALNMLLSRADEIVDKAYKNDALDVRISIEINPAELVTYCINYRYFTKEIGFSNEKDKGSASNEG